MEVNERVIDHCHLDVITVLLPKTIFHGDVCAWKTYLTITLYSCYLSKINQTFGHMLSSVCLRYFRRQTGDTVFVPYMFSAINRIIYFDVAFLCVGLLFHCEFKAHTEGESLSQQTVWKLIDAQEPAWQCTLPCLSLCLFLPFFK